MKGAVIVAGDKEFLNYVMELLTPIDSIISRAMFGGYGIFHEGDMFALISKSRLYFKVDDTNRSVYEKAGSSQFRPMPYYEVPAEIMEDREELYNWARASITIAHLTASKKKKK
jgi:DNA transformation protein